MRYILTATLLMGLIGMPMVCLSAEIEQATDHLRNCKVQKEQSECEKAQTEFASFYKKAYLGDFEAQQVVAYCFESGCSGSVFQKPTLACAWRLLIVAAGSPKILDIDITYVRDTCGKLDSLERKVAEAQAQRLSRTIYQRGL